MSIFLPLQTLLLSVVPTNTATSTLLSLSLKMIFEEFNGGYPIGAVNVSIVSSNTAPSLIFSASSHLRRNDSYSVSGHHLCLLPSSPFQGALLLSMFMFLQGVGICVGFSYWVWSDLGLYVAFGSDLKINKWQRMRNDWEYKKVSWLTNTFTNVPKLLAVRWLHLTGTIHTHMLSPKTTYAVYLVFELTGKAFGLDWAEACVSFVKGKGHASGSCTVCLDPKLKEGVRFRDKLRASLSAVTRTEKRVHFPSRRVGFWMDVDWEIFLDHYQSGRKQVIVQMGGWRLRWGSSTMPTGKSEVRVTLSEVKKLHWKGGLIVQGIEVRPK